MTRHHTNKQFARLKELVDGNADYKDLMGRMYHIINHHFPETGDEDERQIICASDLILVIDKWSMEVLRKAVNTT